MSVVLIFLAYPLCVAVFADSSWNNQQNHRNFSIDHPFSPLRRGSYVPKASKDKRFNFPAYPPMTEKPKWWWRSLACLPYLHNFLDQQTWRYAHPSNNPSPFLKNFNELALPLLRSMDKLPQLFEIFYPILLYFWIVRRKEWPHFYRFHIMNAILVGSLAQVIGLSSGWFPKRIYPPNFWCFATFLFLVLVSECIRCALCGEYPNIPFVKDAALIHSDLKIR